MDNKVRNNNCYKFLFCFIYNNISWKKTELVLIGSNHTENPNLLISCFKCENKDLHSKNEQQNMFPLNFTPKRVHANFLFNANGNK